MHLVHTMRTLLLCTAPLACAGCATLIDSGVQEVEVRTVLEHREVAGVGCVLSNRHGRWFVTTPGRINIRKSDDSLQVDCGRTGLGSALTAVPSEYGDVKLIGNIVLSSGFGYLLDTRSGAGFDYPPVLTILMRPERGGARAAAAERGSTIY
ncbi:hypothetical protein [Massilia sp. PWRC2]|uniref:hypothetical protein n=1 Tax=Massilia sp. PWRC2 TaxID=2804626 RepID=UPI003CF2FB1C